METYGAFIAAASYPDVPSLLFPFVLPSRVRLDVPSSTIHDSSQLTTKSDLPHTQDWSTLMGTWESGNEKLCAMSCVAHDILDILNVSIGPSVPSQSIDRQCFGGCASSLFLCQS